MEGSDEDADDERLASSYNTISHDGGQPSRYQHSRWLHEYSNKKTDSTDPTNLIAVQSIDDGKPCMLQKSNEGSCEKSNAGVEAANDDKSKVTGVQSMDAGQSEKIKADSKRTNKVSNEKSNSAKSVGENLEKADAQPNNDVQPGKNRPSRKTNEESNTKSSADAKCIKEDTPKMP